MSVAIKIENVSKLYRLGTVGTGTLSHDLNRWWHQIRGKEDPYEKVGQVNDRTQKSSGSSSQSPATTAPRDSAISEDCQLSTANSRASSPDYVWALRDINLEVAQGEILGIIGRNGAGKSTLLKLLSRVTAPTTGSIKTKGRIASLLEVGTGFHPDLTGRENIYMNGAILGMRRHEITRQLDEIVEFSGCAKYLDTPVKRYSSGMTVRLGFAVAAHLQCEILIVDEVLAVGDAEFQDKCIGRMRDVASTGRTVLFVSHNMHAVSQLTDRCIVVSGGEVACDAETAVGIRRYRELRPGNQTNGCYLSPLKENGLRVVRIRTSDADQHDFGEPLKLDFEFILNDRIPNACFSFQFIDEWERSVSHYWVLSADQPLRHTAGVCRMRCTIPNPRLYMGQYTITTHLTDRRSGKVIESLEGICGFQVTMAKRHRPEYEWKSGAAVFLDEFEWRWNDLDSLSPDCSIHWPQATNSPV